MEHQGIEAQLSTAAKTQKQNQNEIKISSQADRWIEAKLCPREWLGNARRRPVSDVLTKIGALR